MKFIFLLPVFLLLSAGCAERVAPEPSLDDRIQGSWKSTFTRNYYDEAGNKVFEEEDNDTVQYKFDNGYVTLSRPDVKPSSSKYILSQREDKNYILFASTGGSEYLITFLTEDKMYWQVVIMPDNYIENGIGKRAAKMVVEKEFIKK